MELDESSDTVIKRLAELEKLVQLQKEEIRKMALERDLFAAWYKTTKSRSCGPETVRVEEFSS